MAHLKVIQIGDIHYPETQPICDVKDNGMSRQLMSSICSNPLQNMARRVLSEFQNDKSIVGVVLCGDLTSQGCLRGYESCVDYLKEFLGKTCPQIWNDTNFHVVPGNHDIDKSFVGNPGQDLFLKFKPLQEIWEKANGPVLSVTDLRQSIIQFKSSSAALFSVNSCLGCREWHNVPPELLEHFSAISEYVKSEEAKITPERQFQLLGEQLDMPAFDENQMFQLVDRVDELDEKTVPIVAAHHNILPQATPRIAMYAEVLNSGLVRSRLSQCKKRVVYCHGHIHNEPIELVTSPNHTKGGLVAVSVPRFSNGFNVLEIQYGQRKKPLGLVVHPFRIQPDGTVKNGRDIRVPLVHARNIDDCRPDGLSEILKELKCDTFMKWGDVEKLPEKISGKKMSPSTLANALNDAEWLGCVEIHNREYGMKSWHIRKVSI